MSELLEQYPIIVQALSIVVVLLAAYLAYHVADRLLLRTIERIVVRTESRWDDALHDNRVFERLAHLGPLLIAYYGIQFVPDVSVELEQLVQQVAVSAMVFVALVSVSAFLSSINDIYSRYPVAKSRPIKGYIQVAKIVMYVVGGVVVVALLVDKSPLVALSSIGALTAVLLLIFRDTILSLVASIQIMSNDMVRVGDWIEMPKFGADGDVVDIALHTIKVQNWDKTITAIPTHKLIDESFKNWRGMTEAGGRRIKRSIYIDVHSIRFLTDEDVARFERIEMLKDYVREKKRELADANKGRSPEEEGPNFRRLTNFGTFRAYIVNYLRNHPKIDQDLTFLVRQLQPTPQGVPIEVYVFSAEIAWARYEEIQADIFDHLLAVVGEFDLEVYQEPSGGDLRALSRH